MGELADLKRVEFCFVGADESLFRPTWRPSPEFRVLFVGKLIPLHGLPTILDAARLLPQMPFRVVGSGQEEALLRDRPPNVEQVPWVDYEDLPAEYGRAGCALGIFGTSPKAGRVIPNKVFQALACGTPVITAATPATRELLSDGHDALLVPPCQTPSARRRHRTTPQRRCFRRPNRRQRPRDVSRARERSEARSALERLDRASRGSRLTASPLTMTRVAAARPRCACALADHGFKTFLAGASDDALGHRWKALIEQVIRVDRRRTSV